jgi:hypothetical protein
MTSSRIQELSAQLTSSIAGKEQKDVENLCRSIIELAVKEAGELTDDGKLYLIAGYEDSVQSFLCRESDLLEGVKEILYCPASAMPLDEVEYWRNELENDDNWSLDRGHFQASVGEIGNFEIWIVTDIKRAVNEALPSRPTS